MNFLKRIKEVESKLKGKKLDGMEILGASLPTKKGITLTFYSGEPFPPVWYRYFTNKQIEELEKGK